MASVNLNRGGVPKPPADGPGRCGSGWTATGTRRRSPRTAASMARSASTPRRPSSGCGPTDTRHSPALTARTSRCWGSSGRRSRRGPTRDRRSRRRGATRAGEARVAVPDDRALVHGATDRPRQRAGAPGGRALVRPRAARRPGGARHGGPGAYRGVLTGRRTTPHRRERRADDVARSRYPSAKPTEEPWPKARTPAAPPRRRSPRRPENSSWSAHAEARRRRNAAAARQPRVGAGVGRGRPHRDRDRPHRAGDGPAAGLTAAERSTEAETHASLFARPAAGMPRFRSDGVRRRSWYRFGH